MPLCYLKQVLARSRTFESRHWGETYSYQAKAEALKHNSAEQSDSSDQFVPGFLTEMPLLVVATIFETQYTILIEPQSWQLSRSESI